FLITAVMGPAAPVAGQDLIVNGHFNTDINGWTLAGVGAQLWDPLDWQGNPASGSIRITNTNPVGNQGTGSGQCIPLTPSGTYEVGTHVRFPSGQAALGFGAAAVGWFDNTTCAGTPLATVNAPPVASTTTHTTDPAGTQGRGSGECIPLTPSGTYEVGTHVRFPSGQAALGFGAAAVGWFDNTTCAGTPLATVNAPPVASTTTNTWVESFMSGLTAPAGTVAVAAGVGVLKIGAGGSLAGLFDRVRFGPTGTTPVNGDGF